MTVEMMNEKMALKELVDVFSILADEKKTDEQAQLFTEDAVLTSYVGDQMTSQLKGRAEIGDACGKFLALFSTVYHINGQHVVEVSGDTAKGKAYCQATLVGKNEMGKTTRTTNGVWYEDEYAKVDGKWLIANRISHFSWSDEKVIEN